MEKIKIIIDSSMIDLRKSIEILKILIMKKIRPNVENEIKKSKQFLDKVLEKSK